MISEGSNFYRKSFSKCFQFSFKSFNDMLDTSVLGNRGGRGLIFLESTKGEIHEVYVYTSP